MDPSAVPELLHTLAEVSVAFVGFSTIVAALRVRDDNKFRIYSIRDVAVVGLCALLGTLLPLTLLTFLVDTEFAWRLSSGIFSAVWIVSAFFGIRSYRRNVSVSQTPGYLVVGPVSAFIANPLLWWNVISPSENSPSIYLVTILLLLGFVAVSFLAATFHGSGSRNEGA